MKKGTRNCGSVTTAFSTERTPQSQLVQPAPAALPVQTPDIHQTRPGSVVALCIQNGPAFITRSNYHISMKFGQLFVIILKIGAFTVKIGPPSVRSGNCSSSRLTGEIVLAK